VETIGSKRSYALIWCMPNNDDDDDDPLFPVMETILDTSVDLSPRKMQPVLTNRH